MSIMSRNTQNDLLAKRLGEALRQAEGSEVVAIVESSIKSPEEIDRMFEKQSVLRRLEYKLPKRGKKPDLWYWAMYELPFTMKSVDHPTKSDRCIVNVLDKEGKIVKSAVVPYKECRGRKIMDALLERAGNITRAIEREKYRRYE